MTASPPRLKSPYARLFVLLFATFVFFFQGGGGNQNVRLLQVRALIEHHTFAIDAYRDDTVREGVWKPFVLTEDWAYAGGRYYPNKPPGLSLLGVPSFAIADRVLGALGTRAKRRAQWASYFTTVCTVGLSAVILGLLVFHALRDLLRLEEAAAFWATVCFSFGTLSFSYSTVFQCHLPAACAAFASFLLAARLRDRAEGDGAAGAVALAAGAGFSGGLAVLFEPSCVIVLLGVMAYLASLPQGRRGLLAFLLAGAPAAALQLGYNWACFGSPLTSSYALSNPSIMFAVDGRTFTFPTPLRIYQLLISPARGLFMTSPLLVLAIPGARAILREGGRLTREVWLALGVAASFLLFVASFSGWHGGSAAGPRYLLPVYPFVFLLAAAWLPRAPRAFAALGCLSVVINLGITVVGNELGYPDIDFPVGFVLVNLVGDHISLNPVPVPWPHWMDGFPTADAAFDTWRFTTTYHAFNLGQIVFPQSLISVLPLLLFWAVMARREIALVLTRARARRRGSEADQTK